MDVAAYLNRIDYSGPLAPTIDTLRALHRAHHLAVPFENLDIHLGREISLDQCVLFDKIVRRRRGGFCYEMNGLFAALLKRLGFDVTMLSARVMSQDGSFGPEFDHMALMVRLEDKKEIFMRWLADVGFGDSFREPLRLDEEGEQVEELFAYRIIHKGEKLILQRREYRSSWADQYVFTLQPRSIDDYAAMCRYHQTSPESPFTRKRICSLATTDGRVSLSDMRLIVTKGSERQEKELESAEQYSAALRKYFRMQIDVEKLSDQRATPSGQWPRIDHH